MAIPTIADFLEPSLQVVLVYSMLEKRIGDSGMRQMLVICLVEVTE